MFKENRYILYAFVTLILLLSGSLSAPMMGNPGKDLLYGILDTLSGSTVDRSSIQDSSITGSSDSSFRDSLSADSTILANGDSASLDNYVFQRLTSLGLDSVNLDSLSRCNLLRDSIRALSPKARKQMIRDSVHVVKAREKFIRDSIRIATPRILHTYAVPDSMHYKRIIAWNVPEKVNDLIQTNLDSTYGDWISEYPFLKKDINATYLGTIGSAAESHNFFKRDEQEDFYAYTPYNIYSYTPETVPLYNTKGPYTELAYWGTIFAFKDKEELNLKFLHTQNITPEWNVCLMYERFGSKGFLTNEATDSRSTVVSTNYLGERYVMNAGYIRHSIKRQENGGMVDMKWMQDTTLDAKTIPIHLTKADNRYVKNTAFLKHSYAFPLEFSKKKKTERDTMDLSIIDSLSLSLTDSLSFASDSLSASRDTTLQGKMSENRSQLADSRQATAGPHPGDTTLKKRVSVNDVSAIHIGHMFEFSSYSKRYTDEIQMNDEIGRSFYDSLFYIHPTQSQDSISLRTVDNKFYVRLQPWVSDAVISKIDLGVGYQWVNAYTFDPRMYITGNYSHDMHNTYVYAGTGGKFRKYLKWDVYADYHLLGYKRNDFSLDASLSTAFYPFKDKKKPVIINARFNTSLKRPDWFADHYYSNHYVWSNQFNKQARTSIEGEIRIPSWRFSAFVGYAMINNHIYYDNDGVIRQKEGLTNVLSAYLREDFKFWYIHLDNQILFQMSSDPETLPLPMLSIRLRYYFEFVAVKNALKVQFGVDGSYNTAYYAPAYNPAVGVFHTQNIEKTGNCPYMDLFLNLQWKTVNVFLKCTNVAQGAFNNDYSSAYQYMLPKRGFKLGIHWPFFIK